MATEQVIEGAAADGQIQKDQMGPGVQTELRTTDPRSRGSMTRGKWDEFVKAYQLAVIRRKPMRQSDVLGALGYPDAKSLTKSDWTYYDVAGVEYRVTFSPNTKTVDAVRP